MGSIKIRRERTAPQIDYAEINIPDDKDLGTGSFTTVLNQGALSGRNSISSVMINVPVFQISVNINPGTEAIPVLLGRADNSNPISRKVFILPQKLRKPQKHSFVANFKGWQITSLTLDGSALTEEK